MWKFYIDIFIAGFALGWGPCLLSCGIILPYFAGTKRGWWQGVRSGLLFSLGRLTAYIFLGGLAGFSGTIISSMFYTTNTKYYIQLYGAIFILLLGLSIVITGVKTSKICQFIHKWDHGNVFLFGLIIGIVPCVPLLAVLSYIVLRVPNYIMGCLAGLVFAIGTIISPLIILSGLVTYSTGLISNERFYSSVQKIAGIIIIYFAVKMIITSLIVIK